MYIDIAVKVGDEYVRVCKPKLFYYSTSISDLICAACYKEIKTGIYKASEILRAFDRGITELIVHRKDYNFWYDEDINLAGDIMQSVINDMCEVRNKNNASPENFYIRFYK